MVEGCLKIELPGRKQRGSESGYADRQIGVTEKNAEDRERSQ